MKSRKSKVLFKQRPTDYGGSLLTTRAARKGGRPLATRLTMHLVLRSTKATGDWSFKRPANEVKILAIIRKFSTRYGVRILSLANVGNHLHFQIKLGNRYTYQPFIRAITSAIAMAVTGASRWNPVKTKFWDRRPFTRIVKGYRAFLTLKDYISVNIFEGMGYSRDHARWIVRNKPSWDTG
jgi:hypothetical protein